MSEAEIEKEEIKEAVDIPPENLMRDINKSQISKTLVISLIIHLVLIALLSIGYIGLCMKYGTYKPQVIKNGKFNG